MFDEPPNVPPPDGSTCTYPSCRGLVTTTFNVTALTPDVGTPPRPVTCSATEAPAAGRAAGAPTPARVSKIRAGATGTYRLNPTTAAPDAGTAATAAGTTAPTRNIADTTTDVTERRTGQPRDPDPTIEAPHAAHECAEHPTQIPPINLNPPRSPNRANPPATTRTGWARTTSRSPCRSRSRTPDPDGPARASAWADVRPIRPQCRDHAHLAANTAGDGQIRPVHPLMLSIYTSEIMLVTAGDDNPA